MPKKHIETILYVLLMMNGAKIKFFRACLFTRIATLSNGGTMLRIRNIFHAAELIDERAFLTL